MGKDNFTNKCEELKILLKEILINGVFEISNITIQGFDTIYELRIYGIYFLNASIDRGNNRINIFDSILSLQLNSEECDIICKHIKVGGIKKCLNFKKEQLRILKQDVDNMEKILES